MHPLAQVSPHLSEGTSADRVAGTGPVYRPLDQPSSFERFQVLGYGSLCQWELVDKLSTDAPPATSQDFQNGNPGRMSQGLRPSGEILLLRSEGVRLGLRHGFHCISSIYDKTSSCCGVRAKNLGTGADGGSAGLLPPAPAAAPIRPRSPPGPCTATRTAFDTARRPAEAPGAFRAPGSLPCA